MKSLYDVIIKKLRVTHEPIINTREYGWLTESDFKKMLERRVKAEIKNRDFARKSREI